MDYERRDAKPGILSALQELGGTASKTCIKEVMADIEEVVFTYEDINYTVTSRNGRMYKPFAFDFNFGLKELEVLNYVQPIERNQDITLTKKGELVTPCRVPTKADFDTITEYWQEKHKVHQEKTIAEKQATEELSGGAPELTESIDDAPILNGSRN